MILAGKQEGAAAAVTVGATYIAALSASDFAHYAAGFAAICTGAAMLFRARYYHHNTHPQNHEKDTE